MSNKLKRSIDKQKINKYIKEFKDSLGIDEDQLNGLCKMMGMSPSIKSKYKVMLILIERALKEKQENEVVENG